MAGVDGNGREDGPKRPPRVPGGSPGGTVANAERLRRQGDRIREIERLMWGARVFADGGEPDPQAD
ncbi:hypothetical protein [Azospirillum sp. B4]|uniref:hypothetical protein n=1 Tax=Azospirillum sp. B4 TaxID=95605 RepID=UPI0011DE19E3|nr:hypothetical protein [Azospirillum sp. B4]